MFFSLLYHWDSFCLAFCSLLKAAISRIQYLKIHFPDKATLLSQILYQFIPLSQFSLRTMLVLVNLRSVWLLFISCYIIRYHEPMPIVRKLNQNSEWDRMNCLKWKDELMDCLKWATLLGPHLRVFQDLKQPRTSLNHSNNVSSFFLILGPILGNECSHLQFRTSLSLESGIFAGTFQYYVIWKDSVDSG